MSRRRILICAVAAAALAAAPAAAQIDEETEGRTPIQLGQALLYPSYRAAASWTDNLFYENSDFLPVAAYEVEMVPSILVEIPFSQSKTKFGFAYRYRDYTNDVPANSANSYLIDSQFRFANGIIFNVRDDYETGVVDTKLFDPGGAVTYKGEEVDVNVFSASAGYGTRTWELTADGGLSRVYFPERTLTSFYDVDGWSTGLTFRYLSSPVLRWYAELILSRTRLTIPPQDNFPGEEQVEYRQGTNFGMEYQSGPGSLWRLELGLPYYEYQSTEPTTFRTLTGLFGYRRRVPALFTADLQVLRAAYPTTYLDNNYYLDERVVFALSNDREARVELGGSVTYYWNRYPEPPPPGVFDGEKRTDRTISGEAYIGYRFAGGVTWRVYFRGETRVSTIPFSEYGVGTIGTTFAIGG